MKNPFQIWAEPFLKRKTSSNNNATKKGLSGQKQAQGLFSEFNMFFLNAFGKKKVVKEANENKQKNHKQTNKQQQQKQKNKDKKEVTC